MCFYQNNNLSNKFAIKFLQVQGKDCPLKKYITYIRCRDKSASLFTSSVLKGSITVEAAVILPIFLMTMVSFMYFIIILNFQASLNLNLSNTAKNMESYSYILQQENGEGTWTNLISDTYAWSKIITGDVKRLINRLGIYNMLVNVDKIEENENSKELYDVDITYSVPIPMINKKVFRLRLSNRCYFRGFVGENIVEDDNEEIVYITETGKIYHLYKDCSHIQLSILQVKFEAIFSLRNDAGGKYKKCEKCVHEDVKQSDVVIITTDGDRYHTRQDCSGIKRIVSEVTKESVKNREVCKRCKARKGENE